MLDKKVKKEEETLFRDYDDSSDEEESLDYKKAIKLKILEAKKDLFEFRLLKNNRIRFLEIELSKSINSELIEELKELYQKELYQKKEDFLKNDRDRIGFLEGELSKSINSELIKELKELYQKKEDLRKKIDLAKGFLSNSENTALIMEMEGRRMLYKYLPKYREKKRTLLGETRFKIEDAVIYNEKLAAILEKNHIITENQYLLWCGQQHCIVRLQELRDFDIDFLMKKMKLKDKKFFTEENKFRFLRRFLRQTNREIIDGCLFDEVSRFARLLGATKISQKQIKTVVIDFVSQLPAVQRKTLPISYVNSDINSVEDFYVEELLRYRSLIRRSRAVKFEVDVAQTMVFDINADLTSQKKQNISPYSRELIAQDRFAYRGTIKEEVFNLGNYEKVLGRIRSLGFNDKSLAKIIRNVFLNGAKKAFSSMKTEDGIKLSEFLSTEQKQIIVNTIELLFGTEVFRSPSTLIETNMMLDLITSELLSFKEAFVAGEGASNGGKLSYTMKAKNNHSGGIECGRNLSRDFDRFLNDHSLKNHKYGGPFVAREEDFAEYKSRKTKIANKWFSWFKEKGSPETTTLDEAIQRSDQRWFKL